MDDEHLTFFPELEVALSLLTTVISRLSPEIVTVDASAKKLTSDEGMPVSKDPLGLTLKAFNEEHAVLELKDSKRNIQVGDKLKIVPSHACTTFNLCDFVYGMRNDCLEVIWEISAAVVDRGRDGRSPSPGVANTIPLFLPRSFTGGVHACPGFSKI